MSLVKLQNELKVPKTAYNSFGKYKYRNIESIMEAVKPFLEKYGYELTVSDEIVCTGDRYYVKATALLLDDGKVVAKTTGWAREDESKKGMDLSQLTGACSSYARKYALGGLFLLDDTADADSMDNKSEPKNVSKKDMDNYKRLLSDTDTDETVLFNALGISGVNSATYKKVMSALEKKYAKMQQPTLDPNE